MHVALINMPMAAVNVPSIQLGLLKTLLNNIGIRSSTLNLNIDFARLLGAATYSKFKNGNESEIWFAQNAWSHDLISSNAEKYQKLIEQFISETLEEKNWKDFDVFAFSCTFQTVPALCLGKCLKSRFPNAKLIYGGSQFFEEASLEFMKHLEWIDAIFVGESEYSFPIVMSSYEEGLPIPDDTRGVVFREGDELQYNGADKVDIRDSPCPDYSDFFAELPRYQDVVHSLTLYYEASRGCWYGEKKHCKFCSLNHEMAFRSKDARTVYEEVSDMYDKWQAHTTRFAFTDNILDRSYMHTLMPLMEEDDRDYDIFLEVKPDLKPHELRVLSKAGFRTVQAGIETFHPGFTRLLDKGQSVLNAISFLKWCKYFGIRVLYNLLVRIPFEQPDWYSEQLEILKKIVHFTLPRSVIPVGIQRFGVYYQAALLQDMVPSKCYDYMYPDYLDISRIAYNFDYDTSVTVDRAYWLPTETFLEHQAHCNRKSLAFMTDRLVVDRRDNERSYKLTKSQFDLLKLCIVPHTQREIYDQFSTEDTESLLRNDLVLAFEGKILSLVEVEDGDLEAIRGTSLPVLKKV